MIYFWEWYSVVCLLWIWNWKWLMHIILLPWLVLLTNLSAIHHRILLESWCQNFFKSINQLIAHWSIIYEDWFSVVSCIDDFWSFNCTTVTMLLHDLIIVNPIWKLWSILDMICWFVGGYIVPRLLSCNPRKDYSLNCASNCNPIK